MKPIFSIIAISLLSVIATHRTSAQSTAMNLASKNHSALQQSAALPEPSNSEGAAVSSSKTARAAKQFSRVTRQFARAFGDAADAKWAVTKNEYICYFTRNNIKNTAWYSKNGMLLYSLRSYSAANLPANETRILESAYDGYDISWVHEVHQGDVVVYVVTLENKRNIKQITICNGETNVYREYKKAS